MFECEMESFSIMSVICTLLVPLGNARLAMREP
jgi:hypothetical protein